MTSTAGQKSALGKTSAGKPHLEVLDGLRGTAALAIVVFHFLELVWVNDYPANPLGHGFLAVDFFFCLSGYVTGYAYDDRSAQLGFVDFARLRLLRLHPLVVLGSILGIFAYLIDPFTDAANGVPAWRLAVTLLFSVVLIPFPGLPGRDGALFPYNTPSWSLFMEYVANLVYILVLRRSSRRALGLLVAISGVWLVWTARKSGTLIGGWSENDIMDGFVRMAFSFGAGLLIYRCGLARKTRAGWGVLSISLLCVFTCPYLSWNWLAESLMVIVALPVIVALGAGAVVTGRTRRWCIIAGALSYPLYMTHITVIWMFGNYYAKYKPGTGLLTAIIVCLVPMLLAASYAVMRWYDIPLRRKLTFLFVRERQRPHGTPISP